MTTKYRHLRYQTYRLHDTCFQVGTCVDVREHWPGIGTVTLNGEIEDEERSRGDVVYMKIFTARLAGTQMTI